MFCYCCLSVFHLRLSSPPFLRCFLYSQLLPAWFSSVPSRKSGIQRSSLATISGFTHSHAVLTQWQSDVAPGCLISLLGLAHVACQEQFETLQMLCKGPRVFTAPSGTCRFDIISHPTGPQFLCCPQLAWVALWMCLTSVPLLQQRIWSPFPSDVQPIFLLSLQTFIPWFCHPRVVPLTCLCPSWCQLYTIDTTMFCFVFLTKIWSLILHPLPRLYCLYRIRSCIAGIQQFSWWSWRGIIGKAKFSAIGKKKNDASFVEKTAAAFEFFPWDVLCLGYILSFQFNDFLCQQVCVSCMWTNSTINFLLRGCFPLWIRWIISA